MVLWGSRTAAQLAQPQYFPADLLLLVDDEERRHAALKSQLDLLDDFLADLDDRLAGYINAVELTANDSGTGDAERFLEWLRQHRSLSVTENDAVCCQSARFAVAGVVALNPARHQRFQELRSRTDELRNLRDCRNAWFVVNPIHVWTTLRSRAMLSDTDEIPAQVVFYPLGEDIRSAVVTPLGQKLIRHLSEAGASRWDDLLEVCGDEKPIDVLHLCRELIVLGLVSRD